jgi:leader peptidase (prepilin peptidase)/N-methyltransferase
VQWPTMGVAWAVGAAGYGAAVGPLLPRPVYRLAVASEEPWRDACPRGHALTGPAKGWLGRARCGECGDAEGQSASVRVSRPEAYGPRTGLFVLAGALVCSGLALCVGPRPELAVWLLAAPFGLVLGSVDVRVRRLPNVLTLPMAAVLAALLGAVAPLPGAGGSWAGALLGGVALAGVYFLLFVLHPRGLGFGDVKLALALGIALGWYGWGVLWVGAFLGTLLAAVYGIALLLGRRAGWRTQVPFGPFMLLGALAGVLLGGLAV